MKRSFDLRLARALSWAIATILALAPFTALIYVYLGANLGHLNVFRSWEEVIMIAIFPPLVWLVWRDKKILKHLASSWIFKLSLAYILLHIILGLWALHSGLVNKSALAYALIVNLRLVIFYLFCLVVAAHDDWLKKSWQKIILIPAGIVVVFSLIQEFLLAPRFLEHLGYSKYTVLPFQYVDANNKLLRVQSTLRGANPYGAYLVLVISTMVVSLWRRRWLQTFMVCASVVAIYFTYSRSAWLGLFVSFMFLSWLLLKGHNLWRWSLAGAAIVLVVLAGLFLTFKSDKTIQDTFLHTNSVTKNVSSNAVRSKNIKSSFKDVIHQPLGRGPGTAGPASVHNNHPARIAENYYLQLGQEVGILGLAIFVAINVAVGYKLWHLRADPLAKVLVASMIGISLVNMLSHAWTDDTLALLWWGLAGICIGADILKHKDNGRISKTS